ncbi:MAG: CBS domain-containing protein [Deltaproteobacteria bacterium]|nr:CBS domain-containing protein [Deltaproteobacteria bacterium]
MTSPLITIDGDAAIGEAADLMADKNIRRLLVTEQGKIKGIITERDVMRATLDVFKTLSEAFV